MLPGKSLTELATALEDLKNNSRDFVVPTQRLSMAESGKVGFTNGEAHMFNPNGYAHGQLAQYAGIPKTYYDKILAEKPGLLAENFNHGIAKQSEAGGRAGKPESRLVRTYKGDMRGFLSSSYRRLDSYDMAKAVLPILLDHKFEVGSCELTNTRLYLKALTPKITAEVKKGDVVQFGLVISNSDVGAGSVRIEPLVYRLVCLNGAIMDSAIKKFHVGKNMAGDDVTELLTDETLALTDQAFWAQVRDVTLSSMRPEMFEREVNKLREASQQPITNFDLPAVVELTMKNVGVEGEAVKESIIAYLANGADGAGLTKYGLSNAFTYAAHEAVTDYDKSVELERAGGKIINLPNNQWRRIAEKH